MADKTNLRSSYELMLQWYEYRAEENTQSLHKLHKLLPELDRQSTADPTYEKDVDDLESLKLIYETSIRNFESQADRYRKLIHTL